MQISSVHYDLSSLLLDQLLAGMRGVGFQPMGHDRLEALEAHLALNWQTVDEYWPEKTRVLRRGECTERSQLL